MRLKTENTYVKVANLIVLFNHAGHYKCYSVLLERHGMNFGAWLNNTDTGSRDVFLDKTVQVSLCQQQIPYKETGDRGLHISFEPFQSTCSIYQHNLSINFHVAYYSILQTTIIILLLFLSVH
jgi:hypothetical protein